MTTRLRDLLAGTLIQTVLLVVSAGANTVEIWTPPEQSSVSTGTVCIVGKCSAETVRVLLNGKRLFELPVVDSVFHGRINFNYGLHRVTVVAMDDRHLNKAPLDSSTVEFLYGPKMSRKYRQMYPDLVFHNEGDRTECTNCHFSSYDDLSQSPDGATCLECHTDLEEGFEKHTEVDARVCVNCHQLEKGRGSGIVDNPLRNPCYGCHTDKISEHSQEYIHGPVAGGGCVVCHDPHWSPYDYNLNEPVQILCFSCHEDMEFELSKRVVHEPYQQGKCGACHDPHSTGNRWVLVSNSEEICMTCHTREEDLQHHEHPFNVVPTKPLSAKLELTPRGTLECLSCHDPHSSQAEHLLKVSQRTSCIGCHDDKK